jgi:hypothetical protein
MRSPGRIDRSDKSLRHRRAVHGRLFENEDYLFLYSPAVSAGPATKRAHNVLKVSANATPPPQVIYGGMYQGSFAAASLRGREASSLPVIPREVGFSVSYAIE